ncbi:MAG: hypothetical protein VW832_04180 [bacterium]
MSKFKTRNIKLLKFASKQIHSASLKSHQKMVKRNMMIRSISSNQHGIS